LVIVASYSPFCVCDISYNSSSFFYFFLSFILFFSFTLSKGWPIFLCKKTTQICKSFLLFFQAPIHLFLFRYLLFPSSTNFELSLFFSSSLIWNLCKYTYSYFSFRLHEIYFFHTNTLNLCVSLKVKWASCRQQITGSYFGNPLSHSMIILLEVTYMIHRYTGY
jgi:hypothetical protein